MTTIYQYDGLAVASQAKQQGRRIDIKDNDFEDLTVALGLIRDRIDQALADGETNRLAGLFDEYDVLVVELIQLQSRVTDIALQAADRAHQQVRTVMRLSNCSDSVVNADLH